MATYTVTADDRSHIPDRDACAVTVRVHRGDEDLGLFQTWVSGIADSEIDGSRRPAITKLQRRRIAAELLTEADLRAGVDARSYARNIVIGTVVSSTMLHGESV
jgi:hypothetical protein